MQAEPSLPKSFRVLRGLVAVLALLQIIRISAIMLIGDVLQGTYSDAWLFPAIVDTVVGIGAPVAAYLLWRKRGLAVWTYSVLWFFLSITDHLDAIAAGLRTNNPSFFPASDAGLVANLGVLSLLEIAALVWLMRHNARAYYLGPMSQAPAGGRLGPAA